MQQYCVVRIAKGSIRLIELAKFSCVHVYLAREPCTLVDTGAVMKSLCCNATSRDRFDATRRSRDQENNHVYRHPALSRPARQNKTARKAGPRRTAQEPARTLRQRH